MVAMKGKCTNKTMEEVMDVIERRTCFLQHASSSWNIHLNIFCDHLNGQTQFRKMGPRGMLIEKKDIAIGA